MYQLMIVDDDELVRSGLRQYVDWKSLGFEITAALEDGSDALNFLKCHGTDVIITDVCMYEVSGLELARQLRRTRPEIKVVILSAYDEFDYARQALQAEVFDYLLKPVKKAELVQMMQKLARVLDKEKADQNTLNFWNSPRHVQLKTLGDETAKKLLMPDENARMALDGWEEQWLKAPRAAQAVLLNELFTQVYRAIQQKDILLPEKWKLQAVMARLGEVPKGSLPGAARELMLELGSSAREAKPAQDLKDRVKGYIQQHISEEFSLEDIARALFISVSHLSREFRRTTGESVMNYALKYRMDQAARLLLAGKDTIEQIGKKVGYHDPHYFRQVFRTQMGMTFAEWRRCHGSDRKD